jgi:hypothetical protein
MPAAISGSPALRRTAEQRDELASFHTIELHSTPASQGPNWRGSVSGYRRLNKSTSRLPHTQWPMYGAS